MTQVTAAGGGLRSAPLEHRPKILHILHSSAIGGGPASVKMLALGARSGFEPVVISSGEGTLPDELRAAGVEFHALPLATKWSFLASTWRLSRLIKRIRPAAIHLHGHWAGSIGQFAVILAGRPPTVYSVRWPAYSSDRGRYTRIRNRLVERFSCAEASVVVAISDYDRQTLVRRRLCVPEKLMMIHNAFTPGSAELHPDLRSGEVVTIGFVGRLVDQKGCEDLIAAFATLSGAGIATRLMIVGDGPLRARLEGQVANLGVAGRVQFLGFRSDAPALMAQMDIVAIPSLFEPFGIVAVEAMVQSRPVVASAVGGLMETVEEGVTGRLVPPGDPRALADALSALVQAPATREQMGIAGRKRALDLFSPERTISAYSKVYGRLTAAAPEPAT